MELSVTYQTTTVGNLKIEQKGLYYLFEASCTVTCMEPLRLYGVRGLQSMLIGVLSKDGTLKKSISVRKAGDLPAYAILGNADDGFYPWCGIIDAEKISDAYLKTEAGQSVLALPVSDGEAVPLIGYASQMTPVTVCGRNCLQLPLQDGRPVLPPQEIPEADDPELPEEDTEELEELDPLLYETPEEV